jgi:hypothetical protein
MSQQPTFSRIGSIIRAIANYAAYALGLSIIIGGISLISPYIAIGGIITIVILCNISLFRTLALTKDLMDAVHELGESRNVMQFKMFARFLFNSIAVGLIGFFWAVICVLIMFTPLFFPSTGSLFDYNTHTWSDAMMASMAGEITLCIVSIIIGIAYIPHSFKAWKLIDDYFVLLHDPWARDIGLLGTKKVLDGHKVALGTIFISFGAIGYQIAAFVFFIPTVAVFALVAGVKYIQGLYRVATAFNRIPSSQVQPLFQPQPSTSPGRGQNTNQQPGGQVTTPQPAYFRYQPSQVIYNRGMAAQASPPPDPVGNTTGIQRQIIQTNQAFNQILDSNVSGQQRGQQQSQPQVQSYPIVSPTTPVTPISTPAQVRITPAATAGSSSRCKYCFADLPSGNTGKCPACGAALLSL